MHCLKNVTHQTVVYLGHFKILHLKTIEIRKLQMNQIFVYLL